MLKKIGRIFSSEKLWKRLFAYSLLLVLLYLLKDFLGVFLLTFLFAYLFYSLAKYLVSLCKKFIKKENKIINFLCSINFVVSFIYVLFIGLVIFFVSHLIPLLLNELNQLGKHMPIISDYINQVTHMLSQVKKTQDVVSSDLDKLVNEKNIAILVNIINHIKAFGGELMKGVIAFILSYFFVIDRKRLGKYLEGLKRSSLSFLYDEYAFLFKKIARGFFLVFRAQAKIALTNTILTWLGLHLISLILGQTIPYIGLLTLIVFICSFVPMLGVFISSVPIVLVVYNLAGFVGVVYVISMILIIHAIEAYILNPRFISEEVELPVSLTFLLLLLGEHIFGPIGLIIAVPLFYIAVEIISDWDHDSSKGIDNSE